MPYSTIKKKKCKCGTKEDPCKFYPSSGYEGFYYLHAPDRVKEKAEAKTRKQKKAANQRLQNKVRMLKEQPSENKLILELWYLARRFEMTNSCEECGAKTGKQDDKYYRWSICHIVPKSLVPEVATHHMNWIELCQIHHQEYDAGFERAKRMGVFRLIQLKFNSFKALIPEDKVKWINPYLFQPSGVTDKDKEKND